MKTLRLYRVVGAIAHISAGAVVALTDEQIASRRHRLAIVEVLEGRSLCRSDAQLQFKVGEVLGLTEKPEKVQAEILVPLDNGDDGRDRAGAKAKAAKAPKQPRAPKDANAAPAVPPVAPAGAQAALAGAGAPVELSPASTAGDPALQPAAGA